MYVTKFRNWNVEFEMTDDDKIAFRNYSTLDEAKEECFKLGFNVCRKLYQYHDHVTVWFGKKVNEVPKENSPYAKAEQIKKNLQKFAKGIREWRDNNETKNYKAEYPKGIMATSQMRKNTGSLNFGRMDELRDAVATSIEFREFCEQNEITHYNIETTSFGDYIIRIHY